MICLIFPLIPLGFGRWQYLHSEIAQEPENAKGPTAEIHTDDTKLKKGLLSYGNEERKLASISQSTQEHKSTIHSHMDTISGIFLFFIGHSKRS